MQRFKMNDEINFDEVVDLYKMAGWQEYCKNLENLRLALIIHRSSWPFIRIITVWAFCGR